MPIYKFWIFFYQYMHLSIFKKKPVSGYIYIICFLAGLVSFSPFPAVADRSIQPLPVIHICQEKRRYAYGLNNFYIFYKNIICTCIFSFFSLSPLEYRWGERIGEGNVTFICKTMFLACRIHLSQI